MSATARRLVTALAAGAFLACWVVAPPVLALTGPGQTIVVNSVADVAANDGKCTLREAISAANTDAASGAAAGECAAGGEDSADTVKLTVSGTILAPTGLPAITGATVVDGGGTVVVDARPSRAITVEAGAVVTLKRLTVTGSHLAHAGGAISNAGTLTVQDSTIRDSWGTDGSAIATTGTLTLTGVRLIDNFATEFGTVYATGPVTISNSRFEHNRTSDHGGAVFQYGGTLAVSGTTFAGNGAWHGGAIVGGPTSAITIDSSAFTENTAFGYGGAVYTSGPLTVTGVTFDGNRAGLDGGALHVGAAVTISSSSFSDNEAGGSGGAIFFHSDQGLTLSGVSVTHSRAGASGGAILVDTGYLTMTRSTISANTAGVLGGAIAGDGNVAVVTSTISGNVALNDGGAIWSSGSDLVVRQSTVVGNSGARGGAVFRVGGGTMVDNATIVGNRATSGEGGGIAQNATLLEVVQASITGNVAATSGGGIGAGTVRLNNSIVLGNSAPANAELAATLLASSGDNLTALTPSMALADVLDPAGLGDHSGPTSTILLTKDAANPAIGTADPAYCGEASQGLDQRGLARATPCDIGAVEMDKAVPSVYEAPHPGLRSGAKLAGTTVPATVWFYVSDQGTGVKQVTIGRSLNGGAFAAVPGTPGFESLDVTIPTSGTVRYRLKAVDWDGNASAWSTGPTMTARLVQQTSSTVTYRGTWSTSASSSYSGGSVKWTTRKGAYATVKFTGSGFALVTTRASSRGRVAVYLDGVKAGEVSFGGATAYRYVAYATGFAKSGTHTVKLVNLGIAGHTRVDLDAFVVLK